MTEKELRKLNRAELVEMLLAQSIELKKCKEKPAAAPDDVLKPIPTIPELRSELKRMCYRRRYRSALRSTVYMLLAVAAAAVLVATLWLPVLRIYGSSMTPTLQDGEIIFSVKTSSFEQGDIVSFYYNNKILVKRVVARAGEWVDIDGDGNVSVNGEPLEEPYLEEKAFGDCNIELPYQVPDGKIFVMGDHRSVSVDSRNTAVGCISQEQIVGKILFCVWPLKRFGPVE